MEQVVVIRVGIRVVVAMNEPDLRHLQNGFQFNLQGPLGLQVTQKDNGLGAIPGHDLQHMAEMSMGIAKKINHDLAINKAIEVGDNCTMLGIYCFPAGQHIRFFARAGRRSSAPCAG